VEGVIAPLAVLTIGIVTIWQVNAAKPATFKALEAEVIVVDPLAAVIKRKRRVTELQQDLVIALTSPDRNSCLILMQRRKKIVKCNSKCR
jgi:hypothetical protein